MWNNVPPDDEDSYAVERTEPIDVKNTSLGQKLDVYYSRAPYVSLPSLTTGLITQVVMRPAQTITIRFESDITVKHDLKYIRLKDNRDKTFHAGEQLTLYRTTDRVEEISRRVVDADPSQFIQGDHASTRTKLITNPNVDLPSGFYNYVSTGKSIMPDSGQWLIIVTHSDNGTEGPYTNRFDIAMALTEGNMYTRVINGNAIGPWLRINLSNVLPLRLQ